MLQFVYLNIQFVLTFVVCTFNSLYSLYSSIHALNVLPRDKSNFNVKYGRSVLHLNKDPSSEL